MHIFTNKDGERRRKRFFGLFLGTFALLAGVGAAFAYWTTSGSGTGNAATTAPVAVTVVQTSSIAGLYPGDTIALAGDFTNPNAGSVFVTSVTAEISPSFSSQTNAGLPACTPADFSITGTSTVNGNSAGAEVAHGTGGAWAGLSITMVDSSSNQDNCESLTTIPITYTSN